MKTSEDSDLKVFMIHPIEGHINQLMQVASNLNATVYGFQCTADAPLQSIEELASFYIKVQNLCIMFHSYKLVVM